MAHGFWILFHFRLKIELLRPAVAGFYSFKNGFRSATVGVWHRSLLHGH